MKYLTKEWYYGNKDVCLDIEVDSKAEQLSEEYYKELYNKKLKNFLEEEKEISQMQYEAEEWEDIQLMDDEGNVVSAREIMSDEEFESLKQEILQNEQNKEKIEPYDEEKLTKYFLEIHNNEIENLKVNLPKDILDEVADIRVLSLGIATEKVKNLVDKYSQECEMAFEKALNDYNKHWYSISDKVPAYIKENYNFHDCRILDIKNIGNDIVFELDNSGGFTNINKIIYKDATMLENNFTKGCHWVYDEMYLCDKGYEFDIAVDGENGYSYITLEASDIIFE
ncbi:DUF4085 family protein [Intestinibacter bartlettii]|uniref:DUF4085 domain-containing protein n=1 Tax=Intestinibacter bartlettii TaxID=261299 RepID=A0ABS6DXP7_9FIRM|nr:DUF4085 family protein [Intestinibacter bartlettii]MBU5336507.1 DUF4085 domain-containing protein [Intestinibacter bartlettii]MDO5011434.1 DUF4085 family protein [Intestinibacter bartlettii]